MNNKSPYQGIPKEKWRQVTQKLVNTHPLKSQIVQVVLEVWNQIFQSNLGGFKIGEDIFPEPQIMGFFLHELIALHFSTLYPNTYKRGDAKTEKDLTNTQQDEFSIEIKTSSNPNKIFANRSYAQPQKGNEKKYKNGYFLAINFEKFTSTYHTPEISLIRFGYLEHSDWIPQKSASGQQAHLALETYQNKLITLYKKNNP